VDDDSASDLISFLADDSEGEGEGDGASGGGGAPGWRAALREALGGYDGASFAEVDAQPNGGMHATYGQIAQEEARAARIAREVDRREAAREAAAAAARGAARSDDSSGSEEEGGSGGGPGRRAGFRDAD
jgi:hypothetical protein